jgi:CheY-like chemotaxis protein
MMASTLRPCQRTVLVVDDEKSLRHYMGRLMENEGFRVVLAGDGFEALAHMKKLGHPVHLVISDLVMPVMNGVELAGRLARQPSPPPVLFVSGGHNMPDVPGPVLWKPFPAGGSQRHGPLAPGRPRRAACRSRCATERVGASHPALASGSS